MDEKYFKNLMIEPINICNLRCPVCPIGEGYFDNKPQGTMNFKQFKRVIDLVKDFLRHVQLSGYGEPFLNPDMAKMIDYAGRNDIHMGIFTNGTVLNKKSMNNFKKNYRLKITFSIDGITQKTYSYYRQGGQLKKVLDNLSYLVSLKNKYNLFNLIIVWQFLVMKTNEHEIPDVCALAKKIGVDRLRLKTISISETHSRYNDFVPKNKNFRRKKSKTNECQFIDPGIPFVYWNGDVVPCCVDYQKNHLMGNIFKNNLLDIWNSKKYTRFRNEHKNRKNHLCNTRCRLKLPSRIYIKEINFK